jgi:hypothetical protein
MFVQEEKEGESTLFSFFFWVKRVARLAIYINDSIEAREMNASQHQQLDLQLIAAV